MTAAEPSVTLRIAFLTSTSENNTYWPQVYRILETAAEDLGVQILKYEFNVDDRFAILNEGVNALSAEPHVDAAVIGSTFGQSQILLDTAEALEIPVLIQGPLPPDELAGIGSIPRRKYKHWIGYFYQDEQKKAYLLTKYLIKNSLMQGLTAEDGSVKIIGLNGDKGWYGSELREMGLLQAVSESPSAQLYQTAPTFWSRNDGREKTYTLLQRYQDVNVVWAASDQLAIGASDAIYTYQTLHNRKLLTGGCDLSSEGLKHIRYGNISCTFGSSMLYWAEILVYIYDYLNGIDFSSDTGTIIIPEIIGADFKNYNDINRLYTDYAAIDFKTFSKIFNPEKPHYDFSLSNYFKLLNITGEPYKN